MDEIKINEIIGINDVVYYYPYISPDSAGKQMYSKKGDCISFTNKVKCDEFIKAYIIYNKYIKKKKVKFVP